MNRMILRFLNAPGLVLIVLVGIAIQTSLFQYYPLLYLQPDIALLAVIWCALKRNFYEGGILTLIFSNIADVHSSAPQGFYPSNLMVIYLLIRMFHRFLVLPRLSSLAMLALFSSVFFKMLGLAFLWLLGLPGAHWRHTLALVPFGAVMEAVTAVWVFRWLEKYDLFTYKDPRAKERLEEELILNDEGL